MSTDLKSAELIRSGPHDKGALPSPWVRNVQKRQKSVGKEGIPRIQEPDLALAGGSLYLQRKRGLRPEEKIIALGDDARCAHRRLENTRRDESTRRHPKWLTFFRESFLDRGGK